jgi:hypothetical protein
MYRLSACFSQHDNIVQPHEVGAIDLYSSSSVMTIYETIGQCKTFESSVVPLFQPIPSDADLLDYKK